MIDGDLAYGRDSLVKKLTDAADHERLEPLLAWGKPMLLDTNYQAGESGSEPPPQLAELRAALIEEYPPVGPIFA
jgi:5-methylthioadenosine/S-adenosylhomocysteine deaminase